MIEYLGFREDDGKRKAKYVPAAPAVCSRIKTSSCEACRIHADMVISGNWGPAWGHSEFTSTWNMMELLKENPLLETFYLQNRLVDNLGKERITWRHHGLAWLQGGPDIDSVEGRLDKSPVEYIGVTH